MALQAIYGSLSSPVSPVSSNFITLDQSKFTGGQNPSSLSLGTTAWAYIPSACKNNSAVCKLHVAFHGCEQSQSVVGNVFIENAGYNNWAEANNIIVLYPQTIVSMFGPENAEGCWDWWGYLDGNFANKQGPQMKFAKAMIDYMMANF
uniref:Uncharacterized protein n=1 Tax=Arcella intermedia TaxID=1963864 RepID=A0A6B2LPB6_9EUKA